MRFTFKLMRSATLGALVAGLCAVSTAWAQVPQYGTNVNLETARKIMTAAGAEAKKQGWPMAIAIVDNAGQLVAYERMDNTQTASVHVAVEKAVSSATYRRSTKVFQDLVAGGGMGMRILGLPGAVPIEGGLVLMQDGKLIGAIGVSGMASDQDGVVAKAGADAIK